MQSDNHYITKVLSGDRNAFAILVDRYKDFAFHIAFKIVKNKEEAEEVAQDSFVKAYKNLGNFRMEARFSSWLYKICYYTAISKTRSKYKEVHILLDKNTRHNGQDAKVTAFEILKNKEQRKYIDAAMRKLPEHYQLILTLFYREECSLKEVADITELTPANIKSILFRGRKKMLEQLNALLKTEIKSLI